MKVLVPAGSLTRFALWLVTLSVLIGFAAGSQEHGLDSTPASDRTRLTSSSEGIPGQLR